MRRATILLVLFGAVAFFVARAAPPLVGQAAAAPAPFSTASVNGAYAFSDTFHDPITTQDGAAVGSLVFNGAGGVTGVYSQNARCSQDCGEQLVTRAPLTGTYVVYSDGSATLDICLDLTTTTAATTVRAIWQGAFSQKASTFKFVQTQLASPCTVTPGPQPNVTIGTADKL